MAISGFTFGDFSYFCSVAPISLCSALQLKAVPACYARNIDFGTFFLFQPAVFAVDVAVLIMTLIMANNIRRKYTAKGRKEILLFFFFYILSVIFDLLLVTGIVPFSSASYLYLTAAYVSLFTCAMASLFFYGLVPFNWWGDGSMKSVLTIFILSLMFGGVMFFVCLCTILGVMGMGPHNQIVFYCFFLFTNLALFLGFMITQTVYVVRRGEDRWPLGDLGLGLVFFLGGVSMILFASSAICSMVNHYLDGLFFGNVLLLLSVMMLYKYWDSITKDDLEFSIDSQAPRTWNIQEQSERSRYRSIEKLD